MKRKPVPGPLIWEHRLPDGRTAYVEKPAAPDRNPFVRRRRGVEYTVWLSSIPPRQGAIPACTLDEDGRVKSWAFSWAQTSPGLAEALEGDELKAAFAALQLHRA